MAQLNNVIEIFKLLEKSNCRQCDESTCLAFASAVFKGQKQLGECPRLADDIIAKYGGQIETRPDIEADTEAALNELKKQVAAMDLAAAAQRLGAEYARGKLILKIMGKDFSVDSHGNMSSDIHVHVWVAVPVLNYVLHGSGTPASGDWVPFRELEHGKDWGRFFEQRCEKPLKRVADTYTDLFEDMIHIFNGKQVQNHYNSDISLVLHPLPKMPMLICYWKPDDGLASDLNLFFDANAEKNLPIESIYLLGAGLVHMFEKLALRHGIESKA